MQNWSLALTFLRRIVYSLLAVVLLTGVTQRVLAQQPAESPDPSEMKQLPVPSVAPEYRGQQKPLPELRRVGVDMTQQHPLSLREALAMALDNNKDIEVAIQCRNESLVKRGITIPD